MTSKYYYLFGLDLICKYNEGIVEAKKALQDELSIGITYCYDEELESPTDLLESFSGWGDYIGLSFPEYNFLEGNDKDLLAFIEKYATSVKEDEEAFYAELMMDNHICIEFKGNQYYVPEENSSWTSDDTEIFDFLNQHFKL